MGGYIGAASVASLVTTSAEIGGDANIEGNLTVQGTTVTIDSANAQTVDLGDNDRIRLGDGDDLELYHNGSASIIKDDGVGDLYVGGDNNILITNAALNETKGKFISNGAVELFHDNSKKFETTSTGVDVTGNITFGDSHFIGDGGGDNLEIISSSGENVIMKSSGGIFSFSDNSGNEYARISSGSLLVGTTTLNPQSSSSNSGVQISDGFLGIGRANEVAIFNRQSTDGDIILFRKDGSTVGAIGNSGTNLYVGTQNNALVAFGTNRIFPANNSGAARDNAIDLGNTNARFDDIYATNGTIQTSDEREKQNIASLTSAEITAATAISKLFKTFKWKDKVATKGDAARTHAGVIAQQVETAMSYAGLEAGNYAFFISTTWWETQTEVPAVEADEENDIEAADAYTRTDTYDTQEEAPEGATEHNRKGIRYPELLAFVGAATEQRLTSIEARLTALEG